jgi:hypothetical protein
MAGPAYDSSYSYTPELAARFARRELTSRYGGLLVVLAVGLLWGVLCLFDRDLHVLAGLLFGMVLAYAATLVRWYRATVRAAALYEGRSIAVHFDTELLRLASPVMTSECPWSSVAAARRVPEGLLLERRGTRQTVPIPAQALSTEALAFLLARVAAAGGRVR